MGLYQCESSFVTSKSLSDQPPDVQRDQPHSKSETPIAHDSRTPLFRASHSERYQRQDIIKKIQHHTGRRLICYVAGNRPQCMIHQNDTVPFVDLLHNLPQDANVDLLLHTIGGSVDAAEKLIRLVRSKVGSSELRIIVPELAKSAGTVMVLGADCVMMSDTSELGPIDPQMEFSDSRGNIRWHSVQNYLDAYEEHYKKIIDQTDNVAAQIMLGKIDPDTVRLCQAVMGRARQTAESLLRHGMFRKGSGNVTLTVTELLDTKRWLSHSQMISWEDAQDPKIGLRVEHLKQDDDLWQEYWRLYCLQRIAIEDRLKLYESDCASLVIDPS